MPPPFFKGMAEVRDWMKINGASLIGANPVPEGAVANVPVTTRGGVWYLHAVNGSKGTLSVTPGASVTSVVSVSVLGKPDSPSYKWENGTLTMAYPEPDRTTPHDVIAVTFRTQSGPANAKSH